MKDWQIYTYSFLTGLAMTTLLRTLPFEVAASIIFSFFVGLIVGHLLTEWD